MKPQDKRLVKELVVSRESCVVVDGNAAAAPMLGTGQAQPKECVA